MLDEYSKIMYGSRKVLARWGRNLRGIDRPGLGWVWSNLTLTISILGKGRRIAVTTFTTNNEVPIQTHSDLMTGVLLLSVNVLAAVYLYQANTL